LGKWTEMEVTRWAENVGLDAKVVAYLRTLMQRHQGDDVGVTGWFTTSELSAEWRRDRRGGIGPDVSCGGLRERTHTAQRERRQRRRER